MAYMKLQLLIVILITTFACVNTEAKKGYSTIIVTQYMPKLDTLTQKKNQKAFRTRVDDFIENYLGEFDTSFYINEVSRDGRILNQTNYTWTKKLQFKKKQSYKDNLGKIYYKRFELITYEYPDSISCNNAFNRWLSGFGTMAIPIKKNEFIKGFHSPPSFVLVTQKQITALFMDCEYIENDWEKIKSTLMKHLLYDKDQAIILECGCGGPISWRNK